jgi:DNA-directed RNA polymerase
MVDLVERFAADVMNHTGRQRRNDEKTLARDITDARSRGDRPIWLDYSCDKRGRVYALPHLNFARADHVRAMFKCANGLPLGGDTYWLEIHCANCAGVDKLPREDRFKWVHANRAEIRKIAADPYGTFNKDVLGGRGWLSAGSPFMFVASCLELAGAWDNPKNFVTTLPVGFDGSCNGIQHLACLGRDWAAGTMVNLVPSKDQRPYDVYRDIITKTIALVEEAGSDHAAWWRLRFERLKSRPKQLRKLIKPTAMTYAYSVTLSGATRQIAKNYVGLGESARGKEFDPDPEIFYGELRAVAADRHHNKGEGWAARQFKNLFDYWPPREWKRQPKVTPSAATLDFVESWQACQYLAKTVLKACDKVLPGPKRVMEYIQRLAKDRTDRDLFLEWTTPSGFPVSNRYQKPKTRVVDCMSGGVRVQHKLAIGVTDKINRKKVLRAAAANFTHSMDASHLAKAVNAAAAEGIDVLTIHDSYSCLAPQAGRLHHILTDEMSKLYLSHDALAELRARNVSDPDNPDLLPVPTPGTLLRWTLVGLHGHPRKVLRRYRIQRRYRILLNIEDIKEATYAFA